MKKEGIDYFDVDQFAKEDWTLDNRDFKNHPIVGKSQWRINRKVVQLVEYRDIFNIAQRYGAKIPYNRD